VHPLKLQPARGEIPNPDPEEIGANLSVSRDQLGDARHRQGARIDGDPDRDASLAGGARPVDGPGRLGEFDELVGKREIEKATAAQSTLGKLLPTAWVYRASIVSTR
jgi:hypothetical protein